MSDPHPYDWAIDNPPLGVWRTAEGSFSNVMGAVLTIRADGTGEVLHYSGFRGDHEREILWQFEAPGGLRIYEIDEEHPVPEIEDDWDSFRYRTDWRVFDVGSGPVLVNDWVEDGWLKADGFWQFEGPIHLVSGAE